MKIIISVIFALLITACQSSKLERYEDIYKEYDLLESLYFQADSVVRSNDTILVYNSIHDTVLMETGIFSYLPYYYRVQGGVPETVYCNLRKAIEYEKDNKLKKAIQHHKNIVDYFHSDWNESGKGYSSMVDLIEHKENTAILLSYSLEKLNLIDEALNLLSPYMGMDYGPQIRLRFIELSIEKYGLDSVKKEILKSYSTIHFTENGNIFPKPADVAITIFETDFGLGDTSYNRTIDDYDPILSIQREYFYELLK